MMEWISVDDRLPEFMWVPVLVAIKAINANKVEIAYLRKGNQWELAENNSNGADFITHWMPLPEPPEDK